MMMSKWIDLLIGNWSDNMASQYVLCVILTLRLKEVTQLLVRDQGYKRSGSKGPVLLIMQIPVSIVWAPHEKQAGTIQSSPLTKSQLK